MLTKEILHRQKRHYTAPACGFWIDKIFQFSFPTNQTAGQRQFWLIAGNLQLKKLKGISVIFSKKDLSRN
ncbi:TPA: hypothetical protein I9236_001483 [Citrobacter freundii]|uniref:hypothetical protein n=1 Tax=Citrobacter TaxID=544 RepID=UPI00069C0ED3|nr:MULTISPECIES: hypothetical protein [Enterobacteriaceae]EKY0310584.1 hypothetical protein [Citrobacter freundii]MDM3114756.1 hypothetical protein [Citrobacter sp. Cf128]MDT9809018.1 hypothetical protein [Citrobacter freundii]MDT9842320.1 hypothetical protein [Citrobacter freundii]HAT4429796.1 hypothetical protein [Citrobacter freundii]